MCNLEYFGPYTPPEDINQVSRNVVLWTTQNRSQTEAGLIRETANVFGGHWKRIDRWFVKEGDTMFEQTNPHVNGRGETVWLLEQVEA